jgi:hypothetical protein
MWLFCDEEAAVALAGKVEAVEFGDGEQEDGEIRVSGFGLLVGGAAAFETWGEDGRIPIDLEAGRGLRQISALAHGVAGKPGSAGNLVLIVEGGGAADAELPAGLLVIEDGGDQRPLGPVGVFRAAGIDVEAERAGGRVGSAEGEYATGRKAGVVDAEDDGLAEGVVAVAGGAFEFGPDEGAFVGGHGFVASPII